MNKSIQYHMIQMNVAKDIELNKQFLKKKQVFLGKNVMKCLICPLVLSGK